MTDTHLIHCLFTLALNDTSVNSYLASSDSRAFRPEPWMDNPSDLTQHSWVSWSPALGFRVALSKFEIKRLNVLRLRYYDYGIRLRLHTSFLLNIISYITLECWRCRTGYEGIGIEYAVYDISSLRSGSAARPSVGCVGQRMCLRCFVPLPLQFLVGLPISWFNWQHSGIRYGNTKEWRS